MSMNRNEHLKWCKDRAMEYIKVDDMSQGIASFMSDMRKHPETKDHTALPIMAAMMFKNMFNTSAEVGKFIQDFN